MVFLLFFNPREVAISGFCPCLFSIWRLASVSSLIPIGGSAMANRELLKRWEMNRLSTTIAWHCALLYHRHILDKRKIILFFFFFHNSFFLVFSFLFFLSFSLLIWFSLLLSSIESNNGEYCIHSCSIPSWRLVFVPSPWTANKVQFDRHSFNRPCITIGICCYQPASNRIHWSVFIASVAIETAKNMAAQSLS